MEAFLTHPASKDVSAFNALPFLYRECLKIELADVHALRARKTERVRVCPCYG
jgi:hypothetical protein